MFIRKVSIGMRLGLGFAAVVVVLCAAAVVALGIGTHNRAVLKMALESSMEKATLADAMKTAAKDQWNMLRDMGQAAFVRERQREGSSGQLGKSFDDLRGKLMRLDLNPEEHEILSALAVHEKEIEAKFQGAGSRLEDAGTVGAAEWDAVFGKAVNQVGRLADYQRAAMSNALVTLEENTKRLSLFVYAAFSAAIVLAAFIGWITTRSITRPLRESVAVARRVAAGDLTSRVELAGADEVAELLKALDEMNGGLGMMVGTIRSGADAIAAGATQVASGNQELSSRTEEHASSLEETAATLEEFTTTVKRNAEHAREADALAANAAQAAQRGGTAMGSIVEAMDEVKVSSKGITDIVAVIDAISFQTNILALNAAVEAARAGEQGRGFAVVAAEVRSLAQRSAASSKEIRTLIDRSVGKVEASVALVNQASTTVGELVSSVQRVSQIMGQIASASREQSSGVEQINKAIVQMDTITQANAALVEEAAAAASSMAQQADGLAHSVAQFRVPEDREVQWADTPRTAGALTRPVEVRPQALALQ